MNLSLFLLGGRRMRADAASRMDVMNLCLQNGYTYSDFCWHDDGSIRFSMPLLDARRLRRDCRARGIALETVGAYGLPALAWRMRRRAGLVAGGILAVLLIALSSRFVWDVEVVGNEHLSEKEVCAILQKCDFGVGSYIPSVRVRALENRVLLSDGRIAWLSVYLDGTVARVQVIEREMPPDEGVPSNGAKPANLIAACDGQIEMICLYRGEAAVTVGQAVKKGELLVSGIYSSEHAGFRYTRAAGEILARTEHTYTVEIPLSYREKVYGEEKTQAITLNFFNFPLKIFENSRKVDAECDIIEKNIGLNGTGQRELPFFFTRTYARTYTWQARTRTAEDALELAYGELALTLGELSARAELLDRSDSVEITDTSVKITCTVVCIENIAVQSEFEIREAD
ncbi:MAG: sporulation protein YqfD [Clostridia bacterium]|nr:sporulation protein YqfD [Clostridia bacterium]